jgi:hypothetical protein
MRVLLLLVAGCAASRVGEPSVRTAGASGLASVVLSLDKLK